MTVPLWAALLMGIGSPVMALLGVLIGQWALRRSAQELEFRSRREETMRTMRWAAELAVSKRGPTADLGISELRALGDSELSDDSQRLFIEAALACVLEDVTESSAKEGPPSALMGDADSAPPVEIESKRLPDQEDS